MHRLLAFLFLLSFSMTHAVATPSAMCRHADEAAHAAALESANAEVAAAAHQEEIAAAAAEKQGAPADIATPAPGFMILPGSLMLPNGPDRSPLAWAARATARLHDRAILPLLHPPLS